MTNSNAVWAGSTLFALGCFFGCSSSDTGGGGAADAGTTSEGGVDSSSIAEGGVDSGQKDAPSSPCGTAEYGLPQAMGTLSFKANGVLVNTFSQIMELPDGGTRVLGVNGTKADKHTGHWFNLKWNGSAAGDFACGPSESGTQMQYTADNAGLNPPANAALGSGNCKIHVSSYGAVGEPIVGTFEGLLLAPVNVTITAGAFSVTRCK